SLAHKSQPRLVRTGVNQKDRPHLFDQSSRRADFSPHQRPNCSVRQGKSLARLSSAHRCGLKSALRPSACGGDLFFHKGLLDVCAASNRPICSTLAGHEHLQPAPAMNNWTRRQFTKIVAVAGASAALSRFRVFGANDRVRLGFIGLGNRGDQVLSAFLKHADAEVVALCDIYQPYLKFAAKKVGGEPRQFKDYRKLLELKDIDAVVICTPDLWHALQTIHACEAGEDVYVEKPLSLRVAEGRRMVEAVRQHNRVCQVGIHRRSIPFCRELAEFILNGGIGHVTVARAFHIQNEWPKGIGNPPNETPPADFDWEGWLGPAPKVPYNKNRSFYRFRWFYDYSGGQMTNFGVHYLDLIHSALGHDAPLAVTA